MRNERALKMCSRNQNMLFMIAIAIMINKIC